MFALGSQPSTIIPRPPSPSHGRLHPVLETMNKLPPEILAQIVDDLPPAYIKGRPKTDLARYSTISRSWQASVERITFRDISISSDELDALAMLYHGTNSSRRALLSCLSLAFVLPDLPNPTDCCAVVRPPDRDADSTAFSDSVAPLMQRLYGLRRRSGKWMDVVFLVSMKATFKGSTVYHTRIVAHHVYGSRVQLLQLKIAANVEQLDSNCSHSIFYRLKL
ncbi:hypothetical protein NX059_008671 [Plenodomus lindquistii]|nr:hypothetical protein NX059_008671 [Plenodomus lindquistii]